MTSQTCGAAGVTIGLWIDDTPARVNRASYFDLLKSTNIDLVDFMVDSSKRGWDPKFKASDLAAIGKRAADAGIEVALTVWPDPVPKHIDAMRDGVLELVAASGASEVCLDTEFNWKPNRVQGFRMAGSGKNRRSALDIAGDYLVDAIEDIREAGVRVSLSTFTSHTENGRAADVAPHVDLLLAQAYSVRSRKRQNPETGRWDQDWDVPWDHTYGPGKMVEATLDRTALVAGVAEGRVEVGVGLAAYDQLWPGHTAAEAMAASFDVATGRGCRHVRYWSSKWAIGLRRNGYAADFLRSLR